MYFTCDNSLKLYICQLKGFKRFLEQEGRLIYHVARIDKCDVPSFSIGQIVLNNMRIVYEESKKHLHIFMESCYLRTSEPFDHVELCIYEGNDICAANNDVLLGLHFIFRYRMLVLGGVALHAAAVELNGRAVAFMGFSGAGKSTQAALWQRYLSAFALNLDKPAVFFENGKAIISGTPWSGKEYAYVNREFPLQAIVFPVKANRNVVESLGAAHGMIELLQNNMLYPLSDEIQMKYIEQIESLAERVTLAKLHCTISEEAVRVLYEYLYCERYQRLERKLIQVKIKPDYMLRNIADEWIVVPRGTHALKFSATIVLNETGAFLWNALKEHCSIADLVDALRSEYEIDRETAERDVNAFIDQLKADNILELQNGERA